MRHACCWLSCGMSALLQETGEIYNQAADGILGLGNSPVSMVNQVQNG
jgi:hypothetical protein